MKDTKEEEPDLNVTNLKRITIQNSVRLQVTILNRDSFSVCNI